MRLSRILVRILLSFVFLLAVGVILLIILRQQIGQPESWSAIAGSLAVVTAIASAFASVRIVENEQDSKLPKVSISVDSYTRYGLVQIILANPGQTPAYNITISVTGGESNENDLLKDIMNGRVFRVLLPNERVQLRVGSHIKVYNSKTQFYEGTITYQDQRKRKYEEPFFVDFSKYKDTLLHQDEITKAGFELQKLPDILQKMQRDIQKIQQVHNEYITGSKEYSHYRRRHISSRRKRRS